MERKMKIKGVIIDEKEISLFGTFNKENPPLEKKYHKVDKKWGRVHHEPDNTE